jgi:hypothetical protein
MDVSTAFLNGDLEEEIYMKQPEGHEEIGKEKLVCKLQKGLYGLKQAPRSWNHKFHQTMVEGGYKQLNADTCIYQKDQQGERIYLTVYVDDLVIATQNLRTLQQVKTWLKSKFKMTDGEEISYILGWEISRNRSKHTITISQSRYLKEIITRYQMDDSNATSTPMDSSTKLEKLTEADERLDDVPYRQVVGSLQYAVSSTRPDLASATAKVSKFLDEHNKTHWQAVKRILRYIKGTTDVSLTYGTECNNNILTGYADADFAGDLNDRKSTSGYVFKLNGGAVSWFSKKQGCVAQSTAEAEYVAASHATKEAIWLRSLLAELGFPQSKPTTIYEDNRACIAISKNPENHTRMKHIDVKFHFVREKVNAKEIILMPISTEEQTADALTKPLPKETLRRHCLQMGLNSPDTTR